MLQKECMRRMEREREREREQKCFLSPVARYRMAYHKCNEDVKEDLEVT